MLSYFFAVALVLLNHRHAVLHSCLPLLHHRFHSISVLLEFQSLHLQSLSLLIQQALIIVYVGLLFLKLYLLLLLFLLFNLRVNVEVMTLILILLLNDLLLLCYSLLIIISFNERLRDRESLLALFL